jgi:hypothetical protein
LEKSVSLKRGEYDWRILATKTKWIRQACLDVQSLFLWADKHIGVLEFVQLNKLDNFDEHYIRYYLRP